MRSAWPSLNLGTLLVKVNRLQEAEPLVRESLQFDPNFAEAHYQLGVLLEKQDKPGRAVEELKQAAVLDPRIQSLTMRSREFTEGRRFGVGTTGSADFSGLEGQNVSAVAGMKQGCYFNSSTHGSRPQRR